MKIALPDVHITMNLLLNGQNQSVKAENVDQLVNNLELPPQTILIEHNGVALLRSEWPLTSLADGDKIEILRVAAGG